MYGSFQSPINGLIKVSGLNGAKAYQMPPNSVMPLFDSDTDTLFVKSTDAGGYPTIRAFEFTEVELEKKSEYITREEFEKLKEMLANVQQPIQQ